MAVMHSKLPDPEPSQEISANIVTPAIKSVFFIVLCSVNILISVSSCCFSPLERALTFY